MGHVFVILAISSYTFWSHSQFLSDQGTPDQTSVIVGILSASVKEFGPFPRIFFDFRQVGQNLCDKCQVTIIAIPCHLWTRYGGRVRISGISFILRCQIPRSLERDES